MREVELALDVVFQAEFHVVAQVIETELVVGAVSDIGVVGGAALAVIEIVHDRSDGQAEVAVDAAHPIGIAVGQVVVDGDDVNAFACERVQVTGERGDERFAFAGFHFGDAAAVESDAADQLNIEVAHVQYAAAGFAANGESFYKDVVESGPVG